LAVVVDFDICDGEFVEWFEETGVGACVGAESLCAEEVDTDEAADDEEEDGDGPWGHGCPEVLDDEFFGEVVDVGYGAEEDWPVGVGGFEEWFECETFEGWPDEHVGAQDEWHEHEEA
jgi:hypothetical protein